MNAYSALGNFQGAGDELLIDRLVKASAPRATASAAPLAKERVLEPWVGGEGADAALVAAPKPAAAKCVPRGRGGRSPG